MGKIGSSKCVCCIILVGLFVTLLPEGAHSQSHTECYVFGTQHIYTFDKQRIDLNSDCEFTIAKTCPASVLVDAAFELTIVNEKVSTDSPISKAACVKLIYKSYTVTICKDGSAQVNGQSVESAVTSRSELMVYTGTSGKEIAISVGDSLIQVSISSTSTVRLSVPESYFSKVCGLCGNFDGDATTDLLLANGVDVSGEDTATQGAELAKSWFKPDATDPNCAPTKTIIPYYASDCSTVATVGLDLTTECGAFSATDGAFGSCNSADQALAETFQSMCEYDFCENYISNSDGTGLAVDLASGCLDAGDCLYNASMAKDAVNAVVEVYVYECRDAGVDLSTWRADSNAALVCSADSSYSFNGPKCPNVCGIIQQCQSNTIDGCVCDSGFWWNGNTCTDSSVCGCTDPIDGSYYMIGESWADTLCSSTYTCDATNDISSQPLVCSQFATCVAAATGGKECQCNSGYVGDGETCLLQCEAGQQPNAGSTVCEECPVGTYQPDANQAACVSCGTGMVTSSAGATSEGDCVPVTMLPDSALQTDEQPCVDSVYDQAYRHTVPLDVLPNGIPFGYHRHTELYVSTNGLISFGKEFVGRNPVALEADGLNGNTVTDALVAPYWFRQDLRRAQNADQAAPDLSNTSLCAYHPDHIRPEECYQPKIVATRLCMSQYSSIDSGDQLVESTAQLETIKVLLQSSPKLEGVDFEPVFAHVSTWHASIPYPYLWYDSPQYMEHATYQGIIATDGEKTFAIFIYGDISLHTNNEFRKIHMGYNAADGTHAYTYLSSTGTSMSNIKNVLSNTDTRGRWVFEIATGEENPFSADCLGWYNAQSYGLVDLTATSFACPCNFDALLEDENFFFDSTGASGYCGFSLGRYPMSGFYQLCCYDPSIGSSGGSLLTSSTSAGYPTMFNPYFQRAYFELVDKKPFEDCCVRSDHCSLYRSKREIPSCENYVAPSLACGFGDPHFYTLDGGQYTFNPIGEFWMIKGDTFCMQARTVRALDGNKEPVDATQFQAFSIRAHGSNSSARVHLEINNNRTDFVVYVDDESVTALVDNTAPDFVLLPIEGAVIKKYNSTITVAFDAGYNFRFALQQEVLSVRSYVPESEKGKINGLLGHYDGNVTNDMMAPDGSIVCVLGDVDCDLTKIHYDFGEKWRITQNESEFWYRQGWSTETFTDRTFVPVLQMPDNETLLAECGENIECAFDAAVTNNTELGLYTALVLGEVTSIAVVLANHPPTVAGFLLLNVTVGSPVTYRYEYNDEDGDAGEIVAIAKPADSTFIQLAESTELWSFSWTPTDLTPVELTLIAQETHVEGTISASYNMDIWISDDCIHGEPDFTKVRPGGSVTDLFHIVSCECYPGWTGDNCDVDFDGCADNPCYITNCIDVPANETTDTQYYCEALVCDVGFNRTNEFNATVDECFDIDECVVNQPCDFDLCVNTMGSYRCDCAEGYTKLGLDEDGCDDVNECDLGTDNCQHICNNTDGGFVCSCYDDYVLGGDNFTCTRDAGDGSSCGPSLLSCSFACQNDVCVCPRGQAIDRGDNVTCVFVDECADPSLNACDGSTSATCLNTDEGYSCECPEQGYKLDNNGYQCNDCSASTYGHNCNETCECADRATICDHILGCTNCSAGFEGEQCVTDIDECTVLSPCPNNSQCTNSYGSYKCTCDSGYYLKVVDNALVCENINECESSNSCPINSVCEDSPGNFTCNCKGGYSGDLCTDIDECRAVPSPCHGLAICTNGLGTYGCTCESGYHGDGQADGSGCENDDECRDTVQACANENATCNDTIGSYTCICNDGWTGDGVICTDIDECATADCSEFETSNGRAVCENLVNDYACRTECNGGFMLTQVSQSQWECVDIDECVSSGGVLCRDPASVCSNTPGSYECQCVDGYITSNNVCIDVNECTTQCNGDNRLCANIPGSFICTCQPGYIDNGAACSLDLSATVVQFTQTFDLPFDDSWSGNDVSADDFNSLMTAALTPLFNQTGKPFVGIRINQVSGADGDTQVEYSVVYSEPVDEDDVAHQVLDTLLTNKYELDFNDTTIRDLLLFQSSVGEDINCETISCLNGGSCLPGTESDYPMCSCVTGFTGYNCGIESITEAESLGNLLPLWISVAVAGCLLVGGIMTCCIVFFYQRRRRGPQIHRYPHALSRSRGPAIFNPASRMPVEAYNYQFPVGSTRDSDNSSDISATTSRSGTHAGTSRVGGTVPFTPRWPRAYYAQLGDPDDH